jgi:ketosteroid isomerase-like protein
MDPVLDLLRRFGKAFNAGDVDAILDCVTDDFEWVLAEGPEPPHGRRVRGREAVAAALAQRRRELPELRFSETEVLVAGERAVGTFRARGRRADGGAIDVRGCDIYTLRDGRIARKDSYWKIIR